MLIAFLANPSLTVNNRYEVSVLQGQLSPVLPDCDIFLQAVLLAAPQNQRSKTRETKCLLGNGVISPRTSTEIFIINLPSLCHKKQREEKKNKKERKRGERDI